MKGRSQPLDILLAIIFVFLMGLLYVVDRFWAVIENPELSNVYKEWNTAVNFCPRKGKVVDLNDEKTTHLTDIHFHRKGEPESADQVTDYGITYNNFFAKGTDGQSYPANAYLKGFAPFKTDKFWLPLLAVGLRVKYMDDFQTKIDDIWQTSPETYVKMTGDCEDHAILLADWMISLGYDARVVTGTLGGDGHAWVVLYKDGNEYLLEATSKASNRRFPLVSLHPEYAPRIMFNRDYFWSTLSEDKLTHVPVKRWVLISKFEEE